MEADVVGKIYPSVISVYDFQRTIKKLWVLVTHVYYEQIKKKFDAANNFAGS